MSLYNLKPAYNYLCDPPRVLSLIFLAQDGCRAVIVLFDSTVTVWNLETGEQISVLQRWGQRDAASGHSGGVNAAYMTCDGNKVLTVSKDRTARLWNVSDGSSIHIFEGESACIKDMDSYSGQKFGGQKLNVP